MKGYAEVEVFSEQELMLLRRAQKLVDAYGVPFDHWDFEPVRCHELARAVGRFLHLEVCDGYYGMVEHSWLWVEKPKWLEEDESRKLLGPLPNILDVYTPGRLPQVQLVCTSAVLPLYYRRGDDRKDIRIEVVEELVAGMKGTTRAKR